MRVPAWGSYSYLFTPIMAFLLVGVLVLILRWSHAPSRPVARRSPQALGDLRDYGVLTPVMTAATRAEAEASVQRLAAEQIPAVLATTTHGPAVLVWPADVAAAQALLLGKRHDGRPGTAND